MAPPLTVRETFAPLDITANSRYLKNHQINLLSRVVVHNPHHTTLQTSQVFSRILKNRKESKKDETNGFVIKINVQKRKFCTQEPRCYK